MALDGHPGRLKFQCGFAMRRKEGAEVGVLSGKIAGCGFKAFKKNTHTQSAMVTSARVPVCEPT